VSGSLGRPTVGIASLAALLVTLASLVSGCPAPGWDPNWAEKAQRVLVLPLNLVAAMPDEVTGRSRNVDDVMLDYLAERGKSVQAIGFEKAAAAWHASEGDCRSAEPKHCDRFEGVAPFAARRLRTDHEYDVMVVPYLLLRKARTNGYTASFDGVERPVKLWSYPAYGPYGYGPYAYYGPFSYDPWFGGGRVRAVSLKVWGFAADGEKLFDGIGGLDVVDQIESSEDAGYTVEVRENLLRDPGAIREGVIRALSRLVPRPD
jgi:hypothetical protein